MKIAIYLIWCLSLVTQIASATCRTDIALSTPDQDFKLHSDGTVTHNSTGLMWMRCSLGQSWDGETCTGNASTYSWQAALVEAQNKSYAGYNDWRLPNKNELLSILEQRCESPSINSTVFPSTPSNLFWSSSPLVFYSNQVWFINFADADVSTGNDEAGTTVSVRLVRSGS